MLYLKIAGWVANSVDPDEMQHSMSTLYAQACLSKITLNTVHYVFIGKLKLLIFFFIEKRICMWICDVSQVF